MQGIVVLSAKEWRSSVYSTRAPLATHPTGVSFHVKDEFTVNQRISQRFLRVIVMGKVKSFLTPIRVVAVDLTEIT